MCFHAKTCEIMGKTVLFGVIFHQNGRVWPPGETTYVVLGCCKALCLIGNAFLCISNSVFWVFDIFQKLKIAKNSSFIVFFLQNLAVRPPGEEGQGKKWLYNMYSVHRNQIKYEKGNWKDNKLKNYCENSRISLNEM